MAETNFGNKLWRIAYLLLAVLLLFPAFRQADNGIDISWMLALNKALHSQFIFGKDIIFTYGPLGFLSTRMPAYIPHAAFLLFDVFYAGLLIFLLEDMRKKLPFAQWVNYLLIILAMLCLCGIYLDNILILKFAFFYLAFRCGARNLLLAGVVSLLGLFMKISGGLILLISYPIALIVSVIVRKIKLLQGMLMLICFCGLVWFMCLELHVSLPGYILGSLHLIQAYPDVMYMPAGIFNPWLYVWAALGAITIYLVFSILFLRSKPKIGLVFLLLGTWFYIFIIFKSSFVRIDNKHVLTFFALMPLPLFFALAFLKGMRPWLQYFLSGLMLLCIAVPLRSLDQWRMIAQKPQALLSYASTISKPADHIEWHSFSRDYVLPDSLKRALGSARVDVVPAELSLIFYNGLAYRPRPAIQYFGWDNWLIKKNAEFYASPEAPDYIFYGTRRLDNRFPIFDESVGLLSIMQAYRAYSRFGNFLVLKNTADSALIRKEHILRQGTLQLGEDLPVPADSNILLLKADVDYSPTGAAIRLLFQPAPLLVEVEQENGQRESFRLPQTFLQSGIIINKDINTFRQREEFITSRGRSGESFKSIRIYSTQAWGFRKAIPYQIMEESFVPAKR